MSLVEAGLPGERRCATRDYKPPAMLITGGAGFIGCNFVRYMLETDANVRIVNLDALTYAGSLDNLQDLPDAHRHTFVRGDICDRPLVRRLLAELDYTQVEEIKANGLHEFLDSTQTRLNQIGSAVHETFFAVPVTAETDMATQTQTQIKE